MKTKNKLLTDEQIDIIEAVVDYVLYIRNKRGNGPVRATIATALNKWYAYNKMASKFTQGWIGARELRYLIDMPVSLKINLGQPYEYSSNKYYDIKEAKKIIEAHYTRPKVWHPAHDMPPAIDQAPIIYAIVANDKIARIDMIVFDLPDSSPEVLWQFVCKLYKIKFWAYPQDILPREDDERGTTDAAL